MQVSVEAPGGLTRHMRVSIPASEFERAVSANLQQMGKRARIDGFRPGKVPTRVLQQRFGARARQEALSDLLESSYPKALREVALEPAGQPQIEFEAVAAGADLAYVAKFDVYPEIELQGIAKMAIKEPVVEVTDSDVDEMLSKLREQRRSFVAKDDAAQIGDRVTLDFTGTIDGQEFSGGSAQDQKLELGAGRFLPELEDGIVGMKAGEEKSVPVTFPTDYQAEDLRGKQAQFAVVTKAVEAVQLPAIDADFCAQFGLEEADEAALREKLAQTLEKEKLGLVERYIKNQVMTSILAANPIEVPQGLVVQEIDRMRQEAAQRFGQAEAPPEQLEKLMPNELFSEQAQRRTALGLLIGEIIKTEKLSADDAKIEAKLQEFAGDFDDSEAATRYYRSNREFMQSLHAMVLEEQVVQYCLERAERAAETLSYAELTTKAKA